MLAGHGIGALAATIGAAWVAFGAASAHEAGVSTCDVLSALAAQGLDGFPGVDGGAPVIDVHGATSPAGDLPFQIRLSDCDSGETPACEIIRFSATFDAAGPFPIEPINEWNLQSPAGRADVDADGDPYLELTLRARGLSVEEDLNETLEAWLAAVSAFSSFVGQVEDGGYRGRVDNAGVDKAGERKPGA